VKGKDLFLLGLFRRRLEYPALKRAVRDQQRLFAANEVLIEDKASGTQLIQELITDGCYGVPADMRQDHASARADRADREWLCLHPRNRSATSPATAPVTIMSAALMRWLWLAAIP